MPRQDRGQRVALAQPRRRRVLHLADALHPAVARQHDGRVLVHDVGLGVVLELLAGRRSAVRRLSPYFSPMRASSARISFQRSFGFASSASISFRRFRFSRLLGADLLDLEARQLVEADLEDRRRPGSGRGRSAFISFCGGVGARLGLADDADGAVEVVVDLGERFEDVQRARGACASRARAAA